MTRHHLTLDDGREIDEREVADMVPLSGEPHDPETCLAGCWVCRWERYMETVRWAG